MVTPPPTPPPTPVPTTIVSNPALDCLYYEDDLPTGYGNFSTCSKECGTGYKTATRHIRRDARAGGVPCGALQKVEPCNTEPCAIDCKLSAFGPWTPCSATCGENGGTQF